MKLSTSVILFLFFISQIVVAQKDKDKEEGRFTAAIVAGISLSQIDGDEDASYSKVGFNGGARGGVRFGDKMELCTEILFSQKGAYVSHLDKMYHLDYLEVPVLFYYKDWKATTKKDQPFMRVMVGAGLSYSRLVNSGIYANKVWQDANNTPGFVDPFLKDDLMFMLDANFFFFKNWGLNFRWSRSILNIVHTPLRQNITYAISHSIVIRVLFKF